MADNVFKVNDFITGLPDNGYGVTTENAIIRVTDVNTFGYCMDVVILSHEGNSAEIGETFWVANNSDRFKKLIPSPKFNVGDVVVIDSDCLYTTYRNFFTYNRIDSSKWDDCKYPESKVCVIAAVGIHENNIKYPYALYVVENNGKHYICGDDGIRLQKKLVNLSDFPSYCCFTDPIYIMTLLDSIKSYGYSYQHSDKNEPAVNKQITETVIWNGKEEVVRYIFNGPAVVCIFSDGSKGVAKCNPNDQFNEEYGKLLAYQRAKYNQLYKA